MAACDRSVLAASRTRPHWHGLWTRSLLVGADGQRDVSSAVSWLQGPELFVDLRQPAARPAFCLVQGFAQLSGAAETWLAHQQGFAGSFQVAENRAAWRREIDYQPPGPTPDEGMLSWEGETLVETGLHSPYLEHWHAAPQPNHPCAALRLRVAQTGQAAILVRTGPIFMLARGRAPGIRLSAPSLAACLAGAADAKARQALLDCEISRGTASGWEINASTLPWREGQRLRLSFDRPGRLLVDGAVWEIIHEEGQIDAFATV